MGTTLTGTEIKDTYDSLIKVTDNGPISGTLKALSDGLGNDSTLSLSTTAASIAGTLAVTGNATFDTNTLFVDAAANEVGIGTITPNAVLNVIGEISQGDYSTATNSVFSQRSSNAIFLITTTGTTGSAGTGITYSWANGGQGPLTFSRAAGEVMRLDANGNVGIGTSAPTNLLHLAGASATPSLRLGSVSAGFYWDIGRENATTGDFVFNNASGGASTERVRILSAGGITFNGDTAAANALDDYEEGTWTMGVAFGGASVGVTYSDNTGTYTKIGRQVTVNGRVTLTSKGSSSGAATITGLPFTIANNNANYSAVSLFLNNVTFANQFMGLGLINSTTIPIEEITEAGALSAITDADFSNNSQIILSLTYFV